MFDRIYNDAKTFILGCMVGIVLTLLLPRSGNSLPTPSPRPDVPVPTPIPGPAVPVASEFQRLGHDYRGKVIEARAASWETGATQLAAGVEPDTALKSADEDFFQRRSRDFSGASQALEKIAPAGSKGHGSELATAFRDLATGIRMP